MTILLHCCNNVVTLFNVESMLSNVEIFLESVRESEEDIHTVRFKTICNQTNNKINLTKVLDSTYFGMISIIVR